MAEHDSPSVATPSRTARAERAATRGRPAALEAAAVGVLGPSAVLQLQRLHGNQRTRQLLGLGGQRPTVVQRNYRLVERPPTGRVWVDANNASYAMTAWAKTTAGYELTFKALDITGTDATFTVPAEAQGLTLQDAKPDTGLYYTHATDPSKNRIIADLNVFTGYAKTVTARTDVPAIPESEFVQQFHGTSFVARVSLIPFKQTPNAIDAAFTADQLFVADVKVANERPPTKFGKEGQRSHTVAWSLLRQSVLGMRQRTLAQFLTLLAELIKHMDLPASRAEAAAAAQTLATQMSTSLGAAQTANRMAAVFAWQRLASQLLTMYVQCYQLSEAATYADGLAVGHGEADSMKDLSTYENRLRMGGTLTTDELKFAKEAAVGLLDYKRSLTAKVIAQLIHHWTNNLYLAFPSLMAAHATDITGHLAATFSDAEKKELVTALGFDPTLPTAAAKTRDLTAQVTPIRTPPVTTLPKEAASTFTADVSVIPARSVAREVVSTTAQDATGSATNPISLGSYRLADLKVETLRAADDRPPTRFGLRQKSHTVAWTFVRRHLEAYSGKSAATLVEFLREELKRLPGDLAKAGDNPFIAFDASGAATTLHAVVQALEGELTGYPISAWQTALSELVESYITLYQLSRSATYAKEVNPAPHGESQAIAALHQHDADLAAAPNKGVYLAATATTTLTNRATNLVDIGNNATKLVDAAVATSSLGPTAWQAAVEHWLKLLKGLFPNVMAEAAVVAQIKSRFRPAEPTEETLGLYKPTRSMRDKLLINLYEDATQELRSVPGLFLGIVQETVGLELEKLNPPNADKWWTVVNAVWNTNTWKSPEKLWVSVLGPYTGQEPRQARRKSLGNKAAVRKDVPKATALEDMVKTVDTYVLRAKSDKAKLVTDIAAYVERRLKDDMELEPWVSANMDKIKVALSTGFDLAVKESPVGKVKNYLGWFKVIASLDADAAVNWDTLTTAIKAGKAS